MTTAKIACILCTRNCGLEDCTQNSIGGRISVCCT